MTEYNTTDVQITIRDWSIDNLPQVLSYNKKIGSKFNFNFELDSYENYDSFIKICTLIQNSGINFSDCNFNISLTKDKFNSKEWQNIYKFAEELQKEGKSVCFKEANTIWTLQEVINANNKIDITAEKIKSANLSPLEQFISAFKTVSSRVYTEEGLYDSSFLSRSIYGILNTDKIVCVGYANWLESIIEKLGSQNLICVKHSTEVTDKNGTGGHSSNVVYIKDEKYGIEGLYYADACFSSAKKFDETLDLTFCLVPLEDMKHLNGSTMKPRDENPFYAFLSNHKPNEQVVPYFNRNAVEFFGQHNIFNANELREKFKENLLKQSKNSIDNTNAFFNGTEIETEESLLDAMKETYGIKSKILEEINYNTNITKQTHDKLISLLDQKINRRISEKDFESQLSQLIETMRLEKSSQDATINISTTLSKWLNDTIEKKQRAYILLSEGMEISKTGFINPKLEYQFQRYLATVISHKSTVISIESFAKATLNVLLSEGMTEPTARSIVNDTLDKTLRKSNNCFNIPFCKGDFAVRSKKYINEKQKRFEEMRQRRLQIQERKKQRLLSKQQESPEDTTNQE